MKRGGSLYTFFYSLVYLCGFYFCLDLAIFWVFPVSNCDTHRGGGDTYTRKQIRVLLCSNIRVRHILDKKRISTSTLLSPTLSLHQFSLTRFLRSFCYFSFSPCDLNSKKSFCVVPRVARSRRGERETKKSAHFCAQSSPHRGPSFRFAFLLFPKQNCISTGGKRPNKF